MHLPSRQRGLGMWGWFIVMGLIGFFSLVAMKTAPLYLNYMAVNKAVRTVALDPGNGGLPVSELRRSLDRFWEIEDIKVITPKDIKVRKWPGDVVRLRGSRGTVHGHLPRDPFLQRVPDEGRRRD